MQHRRADIPIKSGGRQAQYLEGILTLDFSNDELILAVMSLIRATNPTMLRQTPDGFTVDFESLDAKQQLSADELLLMKFRAALEGSSASPTLSLELDAAESARLHATLERLESLQPWPGDVLMMSRNLRSRLLIK